MQTEREEQRGRNEGKLLKRKCCEVTVWVCFFGSFGPDCGFSFLLITMPAHSFTSYVCNVFVAVVRHISSPQGAASGMEKGNVGKC